MNCPVCGKGQLENMVVITGNEASCYCSGCGNAVLLPPTTAADVVFKKRTGAEQPGTHFAEWVREQERKGWYSSDFIFLGETFHSNMDTLERISQEVNDQINRMGPFVIPRT